MHGNQGFCAPYNAAIRSCQTEFVALLNNDARVEPQWLGALVSAAQRHQAVAVASKILDWNGETIDFVGGATSFIGHGWRADFRAPATRTYVAQIVVHQLDQPAVRPHRDRPEDVRTAERVKVTPAIEGRRR